MIPLEMSDRYVEESNLEILQEDHVTCPNCKIPLLIVTKIRESDKRIAIQAHHIDCGNRSFVKKYTGDCYIGPSDRVQIIDMQEEKYTIIQVKNE